MANYKEIVTKAVISKGKKVFTDENRISVENPSTILGCWVINHNFQGTKEGNSILIQGSYDVNIWYSYDHDTKTNVVMETKQYQEVVHMRERESSLDEEIIVRCLRQPSCVKAEIENNEIHYVVEQELGIELVGNIKVKIEANMEEDPWDEIVENSSNPDDVERKIEEEIREDYIDDKNVI